jgi:hypothetical protein
MTNPRSKSGEMSYAQEIYRRRDGSREEGPRSLGPAGRIEWGKPRAELARRLQSVGLQPPQRPTDIPEPFVQSHFDRMPIHGKLRRAESSTTCNTLRVTMCNIHDELARRVEPAVVPGLLISQTA